MKKNVAGQKVRVFAFNRTTNVPVTGDAANITCKVSKDNGAATALTDVNPTETEDGYYLFDLTQTETNADTLDFYPESSTLNVQVITANHDRQTVAVIGDSGDPVPAFDGDVPFGLDGPVDVDAASGDDENIAECLLNIQTLVGPKSVKTKEVEIEAHDPMKLQLLCERLKPKAIKFGQFTGTYVKPKYNDCICEHPKDRE